MMPLKEMIWLALSTFVFIAYLIVLFQVVSDLMRDPEVGGLATGLAGSIVGESLDDDVRSSRVVERFLAELEGAN